ncbi:hypothetical protein K1719_004144 [Acacia pycnantha]|nr:hypothetical protein K1719_004144 [Acacia pycnantha]
MSPTSPPNSHSWWIPAGHSFTATALPSSYISPVQTALNIPLNSSGGYLGLFSPENAFNPSRNQVVAVELDSFGNAWDPIPESLAAHVGIDVNSLRSVNTTGWPINSVPRGSFGKARVVYDSKTKELSVTISNGSKGGTTVCVSQIIDLKSVLPEWVRIGFSAATGDLVESHDIVSWSFSSFLTLVQKRALRLPH